ncbi:uncharacterized protein ColSpa_05865 [Colletotrichum spaethianum]|uniref:Uncharacterized protein n=1 Tax=Colletotrichum spaethianum TaxID=700344 RepID=A0AA37LE17_9PEZI|nr:uncharacterized protein ColSpa_05865 [Colletotrichum spaethianum]GKT45684.1 hypothetical protein ColSpa_05865 [Colletotrichum spaethianum]
MNPVSRNALFDQTGLDFFAKNTGDLELANVVFQLKPLARVPFARHELEATVEKIDVLGLFLDIELILAAWVTD